MSDSTEAKIPAPTPAAEQATAAPPPPPPQQQQQQPEQQSQQQPSTPSPSVSSPLGLQRESTAVPNECSPHLCLQDLATAADFRRSFSLSHVARSREIMESIKGLHELHQQGGLTEEEFAQAKQQILDSGPSLSSAPTSKSRRRHRHHTWRSSKSSGSSDSHGRGPSTTGGRSHAKTRSTRHRSSHKSRSTDDSSSSSSSSSDSSDDRFIVVPRANVWRSLNARLDDHSIDRDSAVTHHMIAPDSFEVLHSPLQPNDRNAGAFRMASAEETPYTTQVAPRSRADGYEAIPGDHPLTQRGTATPVSADAALGGTDGGNGAGSVLSAAVPSPNSFGFGVGSATGVPTGASATTAAMAALARHPGSSAESDNREKARYGTFLNRDETIRVGVTPNVRAELNREDVVRVRYFNSRGRSGNHFSDVELHTSELREPVFLHRGQSQVVNNNNNNNNKPPSSSSVTRRSRDDPISAALPTQDSQVFNLTEMTPDERKAWEEMSGLPSRSSTSRSSRSSYLEQSLNWYWIDVTGRDSSRKRYNATLRFLTSRFNLCESFLVDRDHMLVLPQVCESPNYPGQYLLNLRVATDKIAISDDSVMELTNRWIIIVDLRQHVVITLHRVDTHSMANLRLMWRKVIENNDVSFQEFLLKIIDDAIRTYQISVDVHADILDKCEAKLFVESKPNTVPVASGHYIDMRILHHFAGSSRSLFLRRLLDDQDRSPMNKGEMNSFLHHLHRRTSVQHRMLNLTQTVLVKAFTKLRLCSKEMANQMCASCIEVSDRALEVRDDAKTLLDLHISLQSFRTNELMAVLTRVSLLFTPVTFLAGVYGMNFQKNFPELTWEYGYPYFWVMCIILVVIMQMFFLREK